jgi:hypothetical protein
MHQPGRRTVKVIDVRDPDRAPAGALHAFWLWFRRDFVLRRIALLCGGALGMFVFGYIIVHVILLAPVILLAVLLFAYGISGRLRVRP